MGSDLTRPRWAVESEKIKRHFPNFSILQNQNGNISAVSGYLTTSYGISYLVRIELPLAYPYTMPNAKVTNSAIDTSCGHAYSSNELCLMKSEQWSSTLSIAFLIAKAAIWLNKYDVWRNTGRIRWPGTDQHR